MRAERGDSRLEDRVSRLQGSEATHRERLRGADEERIDKKWIESLPNFERLVLGCIEADYCN